MTAEAPPGVATPGSEHLIFRPRTKLGKPELTSIIIFLSTQPQSIEECIASLKESTPESFEILFALPPGSEKARKAARALKKANRKYGCTSFEDKKSLLRSINVAIEAATGEFIVVLDGNVIVTEGWLSCMLDCLKSIPDAGLVGPVTNSAPDAQRVDVSNCSSPSDWGAFAQGFRARNSHRRANAIKLAKFCLLFKKIWSYRLACSILLLRIPRPGMLTSHSEPSFPVIGMALRQVYSLRTAPTGQEIGTQISLRPSGISVPPGSETGRKLVALKAIECAQGFYGHDKMNEAVKALMEGIKATPDDIRLYHYLAKILLDSTAPGEALPALRSVPDGRSNTETVELLALASAALEQDVDAERFADELSSINDRNATLLNVKGLPSI